MFTASLKLAETAQKISSGEIGLKQFINEICDRIEDKEPSIQSLIPEENRRNRLLNEADNLLRKYPDKNDRPPFFGIPVGVKDIFITGGFETKCGSALPPELFKGEEASCVRKLKNAGAIILGKTVTTEFAYFEPGPTRNPHNFNFTPGGSSSGSAAAVAAGLTPFAFGTQTIGSVIRPAAFCGVIGYKPSYGRIPADGVIPFSQSADHVGFFTQDFEGCSLAASLLCTGWNPGLFALDPEKPVILGVPDGEYLKQASPEILVDFGKQLENLKSKGFKVIHISCLESIEETNRLLKLMVAAEMAGVHSNWFRDYESLYRPRTKEIILDGQIVNSRELEFARQEGLHLRNRIESLKSEHDIDLWVTPATLTSPPEGISSTGSPLMNLPWTYAGLPAITIPCGKNSSGLPFGLQLIGSFNRDEEFLSLIKKIWSYI